MRLRLADGGEIAFVVEGDGPPLLLLRPLGGSMALWGSFRARLLERFRVIAFDPRGIGASSPPVPLVTTRAMAKDAAALLDHLGVARAHVFGVSLGGMVATFLAADFPHRVDRLVLASTVARGIGLRHASARRVASLVRCFSRSGPACAECLVDRVLSLRFVETHPAEVARILEDVRRAPFSRAAILPLVAAAARHDGMRALARIDRPTLVLAGRCDALAPAYIQRRLADRIAGARFETLDAGHDLTLEAPRETADRVISTCS